MDASTLLDNMGKLAGEQDYLGARKSGTHIAPAPAVPESFSSRVDAKVWLESQHGKMSPDQHFRLAELLPDTTITPEQADEAYRRLIAETVTTDHQEQRHA